MRAFDIDGAQHELGLEREAADMREALPDLAHRFAVAQIRRCTSATHAIRPHRFAQVVSGWEAGEITLFPAWAGGGMHALLVVDERGVPYLIYETLNWRRHMVVRQQPLRVKSCNHSTLTACTSLLFAGLPRE